MTNVLRADGSVDVAYAEYDFGATHTDGWLTFGVRWTAAAAAVPLEAIFGSFLDPFLGTGIDDVQIGFGGGMYWASQAGFGYVPEPTPDFWHTVEMHHNALTGDCDLYVDAILVASGSGTAGTSIGGIRMGLPGGVITPDPTSIAYIREVKVGTTRGAADVFSDDFASGDLSAWSSSFGDVSVVADPYPPSPPPSRRFFDGFPWRFIVTDLDTVVTTSLERLAANRTVTFGLNKPAQTAGRVPSDDPRVNITDIESGLDAPHLSFADRLMYGFRREQRNPDLWRVRFAGIVEQLEDTAGPDQPYSTYTAWDPWQYLFHLPVVTNAEGDLPGPDGYAFTEVPGSLIAAALLADAISAFGPVRIDAGVTYQGTAFWTGTIESTANVSITFQQGSMLGDAWRQLCALGGMDIILTPIYDPDNRPGYLCDLSIFSEAGTIQDGAVFSWNVGRGVVGISSLLDGDQMANNVQFYTGQGGPAVALQTDHPSEARYGPYWAQQFWPARKRVQDVVATESLAAYQVNLRRQGRRSVAITPNPLLSPRPFIDYGLGDKVPVYATPRLRQRIPWSNEPTVYQRVYGIPITLGDDGVERVERLIASPDGA